MKKRGVGVVAVVEINNVLYAVLQKRGLFNTEKMEPESYQGCLQVTCHGGLKDDEDFLEGLIRVSNEELGSKFTCACQNDVKLTEIMRDFSGEKEIITYYARITPEHLKFIRLGPDTGGLIYFAAEMAEKIVPITKEMKINGPPPGTHAMFPDEIKAVKAALKLAEKVRHARKHGISYFV